MNLGNMRLAPHEELEIRELLTSEITAAKKIRASIGMVQDNDLKTYMQNCLNKKMNGIQSIQNFVNNQNNL